MDSKIISGNLSNHGWQARKDTDGENGFIGNLSSGELGVCILTDYLGGMDDPKKRKWRRKIETPQPRLQEVCFFADPLARRLHPRPSLSVPSHPLSKSFWVIGNHRQPLQFLEGKIFRNLLEA
jgi:hypothetical protein